jgi:REP element-mobilizing transposase RayT
VNGTHLAYTFLMRSQLKLFTEKKYAKRKTTRALSLRGHNHIILKAKKPVLRRHHAQIKFLIQETQKRYGLRLKALAIQPDHIHLLARIPSRKAFGDAFRFLAGQIAMKVASGKLWNQRIWSRAVTALRDYRNVMTYVWRNPFKAKISSSLDYICLQNGWLVDYPTPYQIPPNYSPPLPGLFALAGDPHAPLFASAAAHEKVDA